MVIDAHCHVWPDAVAARALAGAGSHFQRFGDGTRRSLLTAMDSGGIDRAVCLGVAPTASNVRAANAFASSLDSDRLIGFGSIHPGLPVAENVESVRSNGLVGVKVHPLYQGYGLDDPALFEILSALDGTCIVVVHVGDGDVGSERCTPRMFRELALSLPDVDFVACHFGGYLSLDAAEHDVVGLPNVVLDTSWPPGLATVDRDRILRILDEHGMDRVVFASDWPMANPGEDAEAVRALGLTAQETAAILGGTMERMIEVHR
jgi:predicted TIM-barrel fold metal-dependent hydrolase